jgi:hypothetical protein
MDFMLTDTERQLATERQLKYQGTAKINLSEISLHPSVDRTIDEKNVERLCHIFLKDGCQRLDIRNHVTAIVSRRHLTRACHDAGLTPEELKSHQRQYPHLRFSGHPVQCLHGQHRLKAGEETLAPSDQWWIVDLYLDGLTRPHLISTKSDRRVQILARTYSMLSWTNTRMKDTRPTEKCTEKSDSISMRAMPSFKTAGGRGYHRTKPSGYDSSFPKKIPSFVQASTHYCPSPGSGRE